MMMLINHYSSKQNFSDKDGKCWYTPTIGNDDDDAKILPSNATSKSTDTEGVELSVYPDSGSFDSPPKVKDVLTGGKRKGGSKPTRHKKKSKKK